MKEVKEVIEHILCVFVYYHINPLMTSNHLVTVTHSCNVMQ